MSKSGVSSLAGPIQIGGQNVTGEVKSGRYVKNRRVVIKKRSSDPDKPVGQR